MKSLISLIVLGLLCTACNPVKKEQSSVLLLNHTGYGQHDLKKVVLQTKSDQEPTRFTVLDETGVAVFEGTFDSGGRVDNWHTGKAFIGDFSDWTNPGTYRIEAVVGQERVKSRTFPIDSRSYTDKALGLLIEGFESQHITGAFDAKDRKMTFFGDRTDTVDVHGGWYDASGDRAKYLSHLSYANYLNPQQTPLWVWTLIESEKQYGLRNGQPAEDLRKRMLEEAAYGADFLIRMQDPEGYFYMTVFAQWSGEADRRVICAYKGQDGELLEEYQAAFREGGGMAIAALARASRKLDSGEYRPEDYLEAARKGFAHLRENNLRYVDDGKENIIDDYCALMAAGELYLATEESEYLDYGRSRAESLIGRLRDDSDFKGWWSADKDRVRPFFHASDAGLPLLALNHYLSYETDAEKRERTIAAILYSIDFELSITREVYNPFGYPRQYVKGLDDPMPRSAFFIPHQNESGYWWQGENSRLASLATAFYQNREYMTDEQRAATAAYTTDIMNWILGLNPYDICMVDGLGYNNPEYLEPTDLNFRGGVANGITAGFTDESDIAYLPAPHDQDPAQRWRWGEQWMPHAAWLMLAVTSAGSN